MVPTSVGQKIVRYNADGGTRTHDLMLRRHALYPLSYVSMGTLYHACQREDYKNTISSLYLHIKKAGRRNRGRRFDSCRGHCLNYSD
jgi:hypothetical protein